MVPLLQELELTNSVLAYHFHSSPSFVKRIDLMRLITDGNDDGQE